MKQFNVINQLKLIDGELMCKKPSGRSYQKAHYKQGDLDGACGAYSVAMVLNILGVFEADDMYSNEYCNKRSSQWQLIKAFNDNGLYLKGLTSSKIQRLLRSNYSDTVICQVATKDKDIIEIAKSYIDRDNPIILGISFNSKDGHWIVAVGYIMDEDGNMNDILTLDPGSNSPHYCLWNGIIDLKKVPHKKYGYSYNTDNKNMIDIDEAIIITKK